MADFDWVEERANCSLVAIFEKLKLQLETDVKKRIDLRGEKPPFLYSFRFVTENNTAIVILEGEGRRDSVQFVLTDHAIEVRDKDRNPQFSAVPTLSDDGICRLKVGQLELELWQFRKKALETLFFVTPEIKQPNFFDSRA